MTFLQNRQPRKKKRIWLFAVFLLVIIAAFNNSARIAVSRFFIAAASPMLKTANYGKESWGSFYNLLRSKNKLQEEKDELVQKNDEARVRLAELESLKKENEDLKSLLSQKNDKQYIFGSVILRPPQSTSDMIIIDAGFDNGVRQGMNVTAFSSAIIGRVSVVMPKISKIKLLSFGGEETNVRLENAKISAIAVGMDGSMEIKLPRSIKVEAGDNVFTEGSFPLLVAVVEKIESDPVDPFQKIILRAPVNLQEIKSVAVEK